MESHYRERKRITSIKTAIEFRSISFESSLEKLGYFEMDFVYRVMHLEFITSLSLTSAFVWAVLQIWQNYKIVYQDAYL